MVELSQEEKDKLWADLKVQWQIVKGKGEGAEKAKKRINMIQKVLDLEITDFDKEEPTKEVKEYTDSEAEEQFTEPQMDLMEKAVKKSIALKHILTGMIIKHDPKLKGNAPGIGQHVNITYDLIKEELKELMKNDKK